MTSVDSPYCSSPCCDKSRRLALINRLDNNVNGSLSRQSPIMITPFKSVFDANLRMNPISIRYQPSLFQYQNNGHTVIFEYLRSQNKDKIPSIKLGGASANLHEYKLAQFHFHWGYNNEVGSEHFLNDESFSGEIHLVHWNSSLYLSPEVAMKEKDGLVVVGIFVRATKNPPGDDNFLDSQLLSYLSKVEVPHKKFETDFFNIEEMLPRNNNDYYTYDGSLTTSPYTENVKWVVMKDPISASFKFMEALRSIKADNEHEKKNSPLTHNFRNIMPLNERIIYRSFYNMLS